MSDSKDLREERHRWVLERHELWHGTASNLLISAENHVRRATCLDPSSRTCDPRVLGAGLMLRGLGIENTLKGLFVLRGGKLGTGKKSGDMPCKHHDLPKMAELAATGDGKRSRQESLVPTDDETPMLRTLHGCLLFAGRYPIPRNPEEVVMHVNRKRDDRVIWSRAHERQFESYLYRLSLPFYEGREISYVGKEKDPNRITWCDVLRQGMDVWGCRPWLDTGGHVGDRPLSPWAVVHHSLDRDIRLTW